MGLRRGRVGAPGKALIAGIGAVAVTLLMSVPPAGAETIIDCDINGDGLDDLFVGAPGKEHAGTRNAGAILQYHGTTEISRPNVLVPVFDFTVQQPQRNERLGDIQICGDFDGDGYSDLVMGQPLWNYEGLPRVGKVVVAYGGPGGLVSRYQRFVPGQGRLSGTTREDTLFGFDLAFGDFDGDGFDDLAVGAPGTRVAGQASAGAVHVIYGGPNGLGPANRVVHQNVRGMRDRAESGDFFGTYLTSADVGGSSAIDLIVGIPLEDIGNKENAGAVQVVLGVPRNGSLVSQFIHRDLRAVVGEARPFENFGAPLFFGNFLGDSKRELVVGVPTQTVRGLPNAGAVHLFAGSPRGITMRGNRLIHRATPGVPGRPRANEQFGRSVISGRFDADPFLDLAIGVPGARATRRSGGGAVLVLYGNGRGNWRGGFELRPNPRSNALQSIGATLARGDFNGDGLTDLAMGAPFGSNGGVAIWPATQNRQRGVLRPRQGGVRTMAVLREVDFPTSSLARFTECPLFGNFNPSLVPNPPRGSFRPACIPDAARDVELAGVPNPSADLPEYQPRQSESKLTNDP